MSYHIGNRSPSPIPGTSTQAIAEQREEERSFVSKLIQTIHLVESLLKFSLKRSFQEVTTRLENLKHYSIQAVKTTSDQIKDIAHKTSNTSSAIALAMIRSNISLEEKLIANQKITDLELSMIASQLSLSFNDLPLEAQQAAVRSSIIQQTPSSLQSHSGNNSNRSPSHADQLHLPLKKQKYRWENSSSATLDLEEQQTPRTCSWKSLLNFLNHIHENRLDHVLIPFICAEEHGAGCCHECQPLSNLLEGPYISKKSPTVSQLEILLRYTSSQQLATSLLNNPSILSKTLQGGTLVNHQLAILIDDCDIGDDICGLRYKNPRPFANFYKIVESVLSEGINSNFTKTILKLWQSSRLPNPPEPSSIRIALDEKGLDVQEFNNNKLILEVPHIERSYLYMKIYKGKPLPEYRKAKMTNNFASFVTRLTSMTLSIMQKNIFVYKDLFVLTPEGYVPHMNLVKRLFALIILSGRKWRLCVPSCKASIGSASQSISFNKADLDILSSALEHFAITNAIFLPGSKHIK